MTATVKEEGTQEHDIKFWVTLIRAFLAIVLGTALIFQPEKARPMLINFMGMFWLAGGLVSIRWGATGERPKKWAIIAGVIGVLAGLVTVTRHMMVGFISELVVVYLLGGVMILTGLMHIITGFPTKSGSRRRSWAKVLLGVFETVLGITLIISPLDYGPVVYWSVTVWAFLGGLILFRQAWRQRKRTVDEPQNA